MKQLFLFMLMYLGSAGLYAQADSLAKVNDSMAILPKDSLAIIFYDSLLPNTDNIGLPLVGLVATKKNRLEALLDDHLYLNTKGKPMAVGTKPRNVKGVDALFYVVIGLLFLFAIIRAVYKRYFSTLFTVFFNSSLRQSQLTDQLIQAKLPSLFYNLVFLLAGGLYVYLLVQHPSKVGNHINWGLMGTSLLAIAAVYLIKFFTLKFVGWSTGYHQESNIYIFIVFLVNKIIGIFLLPVLVVLSFSSPTIVSIFTIISFIVLGLLFFFRYFRAYALLQHRIKVSGFHFFMYVFAIELIPILLIYKVVNVFILKNL
ncbi:MAG: DUF4271 domain-containing protein [Ferruginibacter sp.]